MANRSLAAQKAAATKASNKKKSQALRENAIDTFDSLPGKFQMELIEAVRQVATDYEYTVNATLEQAESEGLDTLHALVEKYGPGLVRLAAEDMTVWHEPVADEVSDLVHLASQITTDFGTVTEDLQDAIDCAEEYKAQKAAA